MLSEDSRLPWYLVSVEAVARVINTPQKQKKKITLRPITMRDRSSFNLGWEVLEHVNSMGSIIKSPTAEKKWLEEFTYH
jgi:predicted metal-dependent TIM-barrel fold hydrolase